MKKKKRGSKPFVILIALLALAGGAYWGYITYVTPPDAAEEPELQTATARRGDIVITAPGSDNLLPAAEIDLGFRSSGTLVALEVATGDHVTAGQVLARLDDRTARIQVEQAELGLTQAQARLDDARAQAEASGNDRLTSVIVKLTEARDTLSAAQEAYDTAWDPARDWELDVTRYANSLENERAATTRNLDKAQNDLWVAQANYNLALTGLEDDVRAAEWSLRQAELALESAQLALENTVLTAPIAGTVTETYAQVGEAVGSGPVLTLADLERTLIRFYLEESDLDKVAVGNTVRVVFDAWPDLTFDGSVTEIAPALTTVDGTPAVQAWAELEIDDQAPPLLAGMSAEVEVVAGESYNTVLVPVQALRELAPGEYAVFVVLPDGELELRPVQVGLMDFANAEIVSGLERGEVVSTGIVETE